MGSKPSFVEQDHCIHNTDFECASCATVRHDDEHPTDVDGCRVCWFRGDILVSPMVGMDTRGRRVGQYREQKNSWERGIAKDERGMPLLKADGNYIPIKEYGEKRHYYEGLRDQLRNQPSLASEE